jgi:alpha-tubulin suppressor-like RCC1 family protein
MLAAGAVNGIAAVEVVAWGSNSDGQCAVPGAPQEFCAVAAGAFHVLGLNTDGSVAAWGKNRDGQAAVPENAVNVTAVAAGGDHSLALRQYGSVVAWGRDWDGETDVPASATNVVAIAAGWAHSLALRADGVVVAWGNDEYGQIEVSPLALGVTAIAAGYYHNLALCANGTVVTWGMNFAYDYYDDWFTIQEPGKSFVTLVTNYSAPTSATNVIAISAGYAHCLALRADGSIIAWGDNTFGESTVPANATNVVAISAGYYYNLALRADGALIAWGKTVFGATNLPSGLQNVAGIAVGEDYSLAYGSAGAPQFGLPLASVTAHAGGQAVLTATVQGALPMTFQWFHSGTAVPGATNRTFVLTNAQASDAGAYTLAVTSALGQATNQPAVLTVLPQSATVTLVGGWGGNYYNQCGAPPSVRDPRAIAAGNFHCLALNADGTVAAWGKNTDGQTNVPSFVTNAVAVAAGGDHSLALQAEGTVAAWGRNWNGQTNVPPAAVGVTAVAAGFAHSLALDANGDVFAWGNNDYGQTNVPLFGERVSAIAAGYYHNLALLADRTVVSWGLPNPVPVSATNVTAISAGWEHSLALRADGTVVAWGDNSYGQCSAPAEATNIVAISAGYYHSLAVRGDGTVLAWGAGYGANSSGFSGVTNVPAGLRGVRAVAAGQDYSLVLTESGPPQFGGPLSPAVAAAANGNVLLAPGPAGPGPLAYQWYYDGTALAGATEPFLSLPGIQLSSDGQYTLVVTDTAGRTNSQTTSVTVQPGPQIGGKFTVQVVPVGAEVSLSAQVLGSEPMSFQWQRSGTNLLDDERFSGTTSPALRFGPVEAQDSGIYQLAATNSYGAVTGAVAQLTVTEIMAWGDNAYGQLAVPADATNVIAIAAGGDHSLALRGDYTVVAWGDNSYGQGDVPPEATNVIAIADGETHCLALRRDGSLVAWGDDSSGQTKVPAAATNVVAISAGRGYSLALRTNGTAVAWGNLGTAPISLLPGDIVALSAGANYFLVLERAGEATAWTVGYSNVSPRVAATNVVGIASGWMGGLALGTNATVLAWNWPSAAVSPPPGLGDVIGIASGYEHDLALQADGTVVAWGDNFYGQTNVPPAGTNAVAICAGDDHSLMLVGKGLPVPQVTLTNPARTAGAFNVSLPAKSGHVYQLEYKDSLADGAWTPLPLVPGNGATATLNDPSAVGQQRFYRVLQW